MSDWDIDEARRLYNVARWSGGYFDINSHGNLVARPTGRDDGPEIDLYLLTDDIKARGLTLPVLVRFSGILHDRVRQLNEAFTHAMTAAGYRGHFTPVYPIKVNQQRSVIAEILRHENNGVGLEAGSKPELMVVLAQSHTRGVIVCNGYKDREYIRLALIGKQLGHEVYIVVEKLNELDLIVEESRALGVEPLIGVRVRLASLGAGNWQNTGGEKSKFGLSAAELLRVVQRLRDADMLDTLQMMHFHMGSQIPNIGHIQVGMREAARYYAALRELGVPIRCVNVGGGLGVDYEGSRSRSLCSMNYSVQEYANIIVHALWEICSARGLPHPELISESGRAMTAHHALLITNVVDVERSPRAQFMEAPGPGEAQIIRDMWEEFQSLGERAPIEVYHDAVYRLSEAQTLFSHGGLTLSQRACAEQICYATFEKVRERLQPALKAHRELLDELSEKLADKYFCNFSLFQSIPDVWAIDQIFPIMPLHRLNERPTRHAVLRDITCDSDGRVDLYVNAEGIEPGLPLHAVDGRAPYLLGIFLVGAYQEILGDMHNLFGDTASVHVELLADGGCQLEQPLRGDDVSSVLRYVHFIPEELLADYRRKTEQASWLSKEQRQTCLNILASGLEGYTYLKD